MKKPGGRAAQALECFKALYQVETLAKADLPEGLTRVDHTYQLRQQHSVLLLAPSGPGSTNGPRRSCLRACWARRLRTRGTSGPT